jgi:hypothetical protein
MSAIDPYDHRKPYPIVNRSNTDYKPLHLYYLLQMVRTYKSAVIILPGVLFQEILASENQTGTITPGHYSARII